MATNNGLIGFHPYMSSLSSQQHKSQVLHITLHCLHLTPSQRSWFTKIPSKFRLIKKATSHELSDSSQPETHHQVPAKSPSSAWPWKNWMVGLTLSILLPSFRHKWGPFQALKSKVDMAIEIVESVTEVVEELAEEVDKVCEQVAEKLPEDAKLKKAVESVEHLAEEAVQKAKQAEDIIHKVKEVEKEIEEALITGSKKKH